MYSSSSSGTDTMLGPLSSAEMTPEHTVKPFRPMSRLNSVARSRTRMLRRQSSAPTSSSA